MRTVGRKMTGENKTGCSWPKKKNIFFFYQFVYLNTLQRKQKTVSTFMQLFFAWILANVLV